MKEEFIKCAELIIRLTSIGIVLGAGFSLGILTATLIPKIFIKVEQKNKEN